MGNVLCIAFMCAGAFALMVLAYATGYYDGLEKQYKHYEEEDDFEKEDAIWDVYRARHDKPIDFDMRSGR